MNLENVTLAPALVIIFYIFVELAKRTFLKSDRNRRLIPLICTAIGVIVGIVLYYVQPDLLGVYSLFDAIATGGMSALAATGCNQLYKQISRFKGETVAEEDTDISSDDSGF